MKYPKSELKVIVPVILKMRQSAQNQYLIPDVAISELAVRELAFRLIEVVPEPVVPDKVVPKLRIDRTSFQGAWNAAPKSYRT